MINYSLFVKVSFKYKKMLADIFSGGNIAHLLSGISRYYIEPDTFIASTEPIILTQEDSMILMYLKGVDYEVLIETDTIYKKIVERIKYYESKKGKREITRQKLESTEKSRK